MIAVIGKVPSKALKVLVLLLPVIACDSTDVIGSTNPVTINAYPVLIKAYPDWGFGTSVTHIGEGKFLVGEVGSLHVYEAQSAIIPWSPEVEAPQKVLSEYGNLIEYYRSNRLTPLSDLVGTDGGDLYRAYWQSGHIALDRLEGGWRRSNDEVIPKIASSGEWTVSVNADVTGGYSVQIYRREVQLFTERLMSTIAGRRPASVAIQVDDRPGGVHALTLALVGHDLVGNGIMEVWRLTVVGSSELVARRQVSGNPCPWFGVNTALMDDRLYISEWGIGPLGKVWIVDLSDVDKEATITELVCESGSHDFGVDMFVPRNGVLVFGDSGRVHVYNLNRGVVYEVRVAPGSGLAYQELIRFGYAVDGFVDGDVLKLAIGCPLVSLRDDSSDETGLREAVFEAHVPL